MSTLRNVRLFVLVGGAAAAAVLPLATPLVAATGRASAPAKAASMPPPGSYALDPPHTFVYFEAQHKVVGRVRGRFDRTSGSVIAASDPAACSIDVTIDTASLSTQNSVRDDDLRGPDFFDAAKNPVITYKARGIHRSGRGWVADGTLTIHGISRTVPLAVTFRGIAPGPSDKPRRIAFHASAAVRRADFGMTRELLDEIAKVTSEPDVWIVIDTELLSTSSTPR